MHAKEEKAHLRNAIRERLSRISENERHAESRSVCRRILENLPAEPSTICAYFPLKDEVDLRALLTELLQKGWKLYLPRIENNAMVFRKAESIESLTPGQYGIPEPALSDPLLDPQDLTYALTPARAFDKKGHRLGRGNGGYDIWIRKQRAANPKTKFWGVALEAQIVQQIPMEAHDEKVDAIVTARGLFGPEK